MGGGGEKNETHRELLDNYYEASWALAMEQVAVRQGERAKELQKQLEEDPGQRYRSTPYGAAGWPSEGLLRPVWDGGYGAC